MAIGIFEQLAWLTKKVNQLCCIVKNGGSGSVEVDGTTIKGDGTLASPLAITTALPVIDMNVDLGGGDFDLAGAGIYMITNFGNSFLFNNTGIVDGSRVIVTNSNALSTSFATVGGTGVSVLYQGTQQSVTRIPSGMSYEFIYDASTNTWYCLNPTPQIAPAKIDLDAWGGIYAINTPGFFTFFNNTTGYDIGLPDPGQFNGLQLVIWNQENTSLGYSSAGYVQPVLPNNAARTLMPDRSVDILCSMDGEWVKVNN